MDKCRRILNVPERASVPEGQSSKREKRIDQFYLVCRLIAQNLVHAVKAQEYKPICNKKRRLSNKE